MHNHGLRLFEECTLVVKPVQDVSIRVNNLPPDDLSSRRFLLFLKQDATKVSS